MRTEVRRTKARHTWEIQPRHGYRILLPLGSREEAEILLPVARTLAKTYQGQVILLHVVAVPEGRPLSEGAAEASRVRQQIDEFLSQKGMSDVPVRTVVRVAHEIWEGIWETVRQENIDMLILGWSSDTLSPVLGPLEDPRLANPPCDVVIVRPGEQLRQEQDWSNIKRILLPIRGGPHASLSLAVADALADALQADITILHVSEPPRYEDAEQFQSTWAPALHQLDSVTRTITAVGDVATAILREASDHELIVMGASVRRVDPDGWIGPILREVTRNTRASVIVTKERAPEVTTYITKEQEERAHIEKPLTVIVNKWFAENTFHSREFEEIERLVELKEEQGLTISLGLPALNEEETVGNVIQTVKSALMERFPLLDEIVLIDSGSVDYTREIAADLGIPVYIHQEVLTQYGAYHGKGEALWKSLYILNGDIIAWIDTDIKNIHPRFVYGILGPLLKNPRIMYVKGFYRRPLRQGNKLVAGGGGRVTELTARPLLNLFFPELSGLIQPLSGEYAGRRSALERLPFFTGYGVETGLLIDMLEGFGLHAIAQVDLLERVHHNQPLQALSKMAFAIIQVVIRRLEDRHKIRLLADINKTMNLIRYEPNRYYLETVEIIERERPPMITLPEYRQKRGLPDDVEDCVPRASTT